MAYFTVNKYLDIGNINGLTRSVWEAATDKDFNNVINRAILTSGDLLSCHMALQKPDGTWYEESDTIYVRVKLYSENGESPWFIMDADKSHLISLWINDNIPDNINDTIKKRVGLIETDRNYKVVTDIVDELYVDEKLKTFRNEEYREDY